MTEYIERKKLFKLINNWKRDDVIPIIEGHIVGYPEGWNEALEQIESDIEDTPAADVAPVIHGHWIYDSGSFRCSVCKDISVVDFRTPYCPQCGAEMNGGGD